MKKLIIILLALITAAGCSFPDMYDYEPQIVVEGWWLSCSHSDKYRSGYRGLQVLG